MSRFLKFLRELDPLVHLFFLICIVSLLVGFYFLHQRTVDLSQKVGQKVVTGQEAEKIQTQEVDRCGNLCLSEIKKAVAAGIASLRSGTSNTKQQFTFIPLTGPSTTTKTDWADLKNTDVTIDFRGDYGVRAKITWEAFLKVANANGTSYARLLDATHGTTVDGSEISLTNNANITSVVSGEMNPWSGKNTYRVQIKSLNNSEVTFDSGRIKISY